MTTGTRLLPRRNRPYDAGTSYQPGARFGPSAIRAADYLPHDVSRPHLALGVDALRDLVVRDAGDVEMPPTETPLALRRLEEAVHAGAGRPHRPAAARCRPQLPIVGMDLVEVAPAYDSADITALLANRVLLEALSGWAARRRRPE